MKKITVLLICAVLILLTAGCAEVNPANSSSVPLPSYLGTVTTTDEGCAAEYTVFGNTAEIVVKNSENNPVSPKNVTINSPDTLFSDGIVCVEIRISDTLTVELDLKAAMNENPDGAIIFGNEENTITVKNDNTVLFTADLTSVIDSTSRLVYDGKTVKAIDPDGRVITEFDLP